VCGSALIRLTRSPEQSDVSEHDGDGEKRHSDRKKCARMLKRIQKVDLCVHSDLRPNETELSDRWRERGLFLITDN